MSVSSTSGAASSADLVLIGRVREAMDVYGMNQIDVMRDSGVSNSVLCLWLQNKYKGDNAKVNDRLHKWIDNIPPLSSSTPHLHSSQPTPVFLQPPSYASSHRAAHVEHLIPVHLDVVVGAQRYEDSFLWSLYEATITPRVFCQSLCNDVGLPHAFISAMVTQMKEQIKRYKRLMKEKEERDTSQLPLPVPPRSRLLRLSLDLTLDGLRLTDRFLWDPTHPSSSPEDFGRVLAAELGLSGEWAALIAWSVRDQLGRWLEGGDEVPWMQEDGEVFRQEGEGWGPVVQEVYSRLEHVDSAGVGSVGVDAGQLTEYEKEKERDRAVQRSKRKEEKEKEKEREDRDKERPAEGGGGMPQEPPPITPAGYARLAQAVAQADAFRFQ